jgi:hypothetical protein
MVNGFGSLVNVKVFTKNFIDETKKLFDNYLSDSIRYGGVDCKSAAEAYHNLGRFHYRIVTGFHLGSQAAVKSNL